MSLINVNIPGTPVVERNGRIIYRVNEWGATATIPATATPQELAAIGLYERVMVEDPFDPATQKLGSRTGPVLDSVAGTATFTRAVVNLTQDELDSIAEAEANNQERDQLKAIYETFKNAQATNAQAQKAIAWLIKNMAGV